MIEKEIRKMIKEIEKSKKIIAKERDRLRDILYDLHSFDSSISQGIEDIEHGIDKISEQI